MALPTLVNGDLAGAHRLPRSARGDLHLEPGGRFQDEEEITERLARVHRHVGGQGGGRSSLLGVEPVEARAHLERKLAGDTRDDFVGLARPVHPDARVGDRRPPCILDEAAKEAAAGQLQAQGRRGGDEEAVLEERGETSGLDVQPPCSRHQASQGEAPFSVGLHLVALGLGGDGPAPRVPMAQARGECHGGVGDRLARGHIDHHPLQRHGGDERERDARPSGAGRALDQEAGLESIRARGVGRVGSGRQRQAQNPVCIGPPAECGPATPRARRPGVAIEPHLDIADRRTGGRDEELQASLLRVNFVEEAVLQLRRPRRDAGGFHFAREIGGGQRGLRGFSPPPDGSEESEHDGDEGESVGATHLPNIS